MSYQREKESACKKVWKDVSDLASSLCETRRCGLARHVIHCWGSDSREVFPWHCARPRAALAMLWNQERLEGDKVFLQAKQGEMQRYPPSSLPSRSQNVASEPGCGVSTKGMESTALQAGGL